MAYLSARHFQHHGHYSRLASTNHVSQSTILYYLDMLRLVVR